MFLKGKQLDFWEREWYIQKLPRNDKTLYEDAKTTVTYKNSFNIHTEARMTKNEENRRCKEGKKTNSPSIKCLETEYWSFSVSDFPWSPGMQQKQKPKYNSAQYTLSQLDAAKYILLEAKRTALTDARLNVSISGLSCPIVLKHSYGLEINGT